jgi:hypothetical protein
MNRAVGLISLLIILVSACSDKELSTTKPSSKIFEEIQVSESGINFRNDLTVSDSMNFFTYGYFYMGGGVAVGDFNNDGLQDVFFTGNMVDNQLYLNKGDLNFENITASSGIESEAKWFTGVTVADVNQDGLEDIYLSVAGKWNSRKNELWINKGTDDSGVPQFVEEAEAYGIADNSYSIQSVFFDYDNDGDLDLLVGNYEPTPFDSYSFEYRKKIDANTWEASDHLYRNNGNGTFTDVTELSGIQNFGLTIGVLANDFNQDGFIDLYLSNDFSAPDRFFINQGDGTFKNHLEDAFTHTSFYGMGVDAADFNQDGKLDLFQLDMSPVDNYRSKANMASMDIQAFWNNIELGFHYQYMYNSLQTYQGTKDGIPYYGDQAKFSNLESTDWSWACLFADYDNDGFKDLYITNGTRKDINNKDYFNWLERIDISLKVKYKELSVEDLMNKMPSKKVDNYMFKNVGGKHFKHVNKDWGISREDFSNGLAYADLDNDGDLELIINNIDTTACVFKNLSVEAGQNNFITFDLKGTTKNQNGLGAKMWLHHNGKTQFHEHTRTRGFQSSVSERIHFGLGQDQKIDSLVVVWPNGQREVFGEMAVNENRELIIGSAEVSQHMEQVPETYFESLDIAQFTWSHKENKFDDFKREILIPHQMSSFGPGLAYGEALDQSSKYIFMGGAFEQKSSIITLDAFDKETVQVLEDAGHESNAALFLDADKDGDLDLLVGSGGSEEKHDSDYYKDHFYRNDNGTFVLDKSALPKEYLNSCSVIKSIDFDMDGDMDIFIGGRQIPGQYPMPASSYLLENVSRNGKIEFKLAAADFNEVLQNIGMVTDADWNDFNQDGKPDLIMVGEWMSPKVFLNNGFELVDKTDDFFRDDFTGWWNCLKLVDINNDGLKDLVAGNLGNNYKYKARNGKTFDVYLDDFDANEKLDIVLGYFEGDKQYPVRGKQCSSEQIPNIKKKFNSYDAFASSDLSDIYGESNLEKALHYKANQFNTMIFIREPKGGFRSVDVPVEVQMTNINAVESVDIDSDGYLDLVLAGNMFDSEVETPRSDASYGLLLRNKGDNSFELIPNDQSGFHIPYETRQIIKMMHGGKELLFFGNNNAPLLVYSLKNDIDEDEKLADLN